MNNKTKKMTLIALLSALAYVASVVIKFRVVEFLSYEPKDVIIALGGFLLGPLSAFVISIIVSFIEMVTVSSAGPIGFLMNVISTASFVCTASYLYKKNKSIKGAVLSLAIGVIVMTITMMAWNYLITPIYMKVPRSVVVDMLIPAFLPFNILKGSINATIVILIYKPLIIPLFSRFNLIDKQENKGKINMGLMMGAVFVLATCIFFVFVLQGKI